MEELLKKTQKLNSKFANTVYEAEVGHWCKTAEDLMLIRALKEQDGIKFLFDVYEKEINLIDQRLLESSSIELPDYERDLLIIKKVFFKSFVDFFKLSDKKLKEIENKIGDNL